MVFQSLYNVAIELLTFWLPVFYTFKFLMNKESTRIPTILKFWCMLSCYNLISLVLKNILDDNIFPIINFAALLSLNWPPYEIAQKMYDFSLGPIFHQNRKSFQSLEESIIQTFNKNTENIKNRVKDSTGDRVKGLVGDVLMATMSNSRGAKEEQKAKKSDSESGSDSD